VNKIQDLDMKLAKRRRPWSRKNLTTAMRVRERVFRGLDVLSNTVANSVTVQRKIMKHLAVAGILDLFGALGEIRTPDPQIRSLLPSVFGTSLPREIARWLANKCPILLIFSHVVVGWRNQTGKRSPWHLPY
jgi:hypothetical protein